MGGTWKEIVNIGEFSLEQETKNKNKRTRTREQEQENLNKRIFAGFSQSSFSKDFKCGNKEEEIAVVNMKTTPSLSPTDGSEKELVIQGSNMVSGTRCPARSDPVKKWSESRAVASKVRCPVEHRGEFSKP